MELQWIFEPPIAAHDEDGKIYEAVIAKHDGYFVSIYHGAEVDPDLTAAQGRQRYRNVPMIAIKNKGERDFVSTAYTKEHVYRFPRAARWWEARQNEVPRVSVSLLPGISPADLMELAELEILDVGTLATKDVPENLSIFRELAKRFQTLSKPRMRLVDGAMEQVA